MNTRFFVLAISALVLLPLSEAGAKSTRLYFAGYMGLNTHTESEYTESTRSTNGDLELENGYNFAGALGIRVNRNLSLEAELAYRKSNVANIAVNGSDERPVDGEIKSTTLLFNGIYNFDTSWRDMYPYLSAGVGVVWHNGEITDTTGGIADVSGDDVGFAWTVGGGIKYEVEEGTSFTAGYRYLSSTEIGFENATLDYSGHEFRIGVEYDLK